MIDFLKGSIDVFSEIGDLLKIIIKGIGDFVGFILNFPSFCISIINVIPEPFHSIILPFISLIIFLIVVYVVSKLVSVVKGG